MTPREVLQEIAKIEPRLKREFLAYVFGVVSDTKMARLERLVSAGDIAGIIDLLDISEERLAAFLESLRGVFAQGAALEAASQATRLRLRFNIRNEAAERWLRENSSRLVVEIVEEQRRVIRQVVSTGTQLGRNPRQTALDLVGRVSTTGRRSGGVIGLTTRQAEYVANARRELQSLDPGYFTRTRRDARFDATVRSAIESGKPLSRDQIDRITGRYSDRLLAYRAEVIARTEALQAFNTGRNEVFRQAIEAGRIRGENVLKVWRTAADGRVRDTHSALNGSKVPMSAPFVSSSGAQLMYPQDTSLGASSAEVIQCRCVAEYRIDFLAERLGNGR